MGANFNTLTFEGTLPTDEMKGLFDNAVADSQYQHGHSYSGEIGMVTGLTITSKVFDTEDEAYQYLLKTAEKWGPAVAVKYLLPSGEQEWYIGAWCSS